MGIKNNRLVVSIYNKTKGYRKNIRGVKNTLNTTNSIMRNSQIEIVGNENSVFLGKNTRLFNSKIFVSGRKHNLTVGEDCVIKNAIIWIEDDQCRISIGKKTTIEGGHIAVTEPNSSIKIGEDCMFSSGVDIRNGDSHSIIDINSKERINFAKDITINDHVWLGAHVQVLKGVSIGQNSIVGVRSLVTKDIPHNSIAIGAPAKVAKSNIIWSRKRIYDSEEVISYLEQTVR